jgi:hypothetical protein
VLLGLARYAVGEAGWDVSACSGTGADVCEDEAGALPTRTEDTKRLLKQKSAAISIIQRIEREDCRGPPDALKHLPPSP